MKCASSLALLACSVVAVANGASVRGADEEASRSLQAVTTTSSCDPTIISLNFNDLEAGDVLTDSITLIEGVTVKARKAFVGPFDDAMIFDARNPTGQDNDLSHFPFLRNMLIISADNDPSDPDDAAVGGEAIVTFPYAVKMNFMRFVDFDEKLGDVGLFDANGDLIKGFKMPTSVDAGQKTVNMSQGGVWSLKIRFRGSGAVDDIRFARDC